MTWAYALGRSCCSARRLIVFQTLAIPSLKLDISGSAAGLSFADPCSLFLSAVSWMNRCMGSELARLQRTEFGEVSLCQKFERGQAFVSLCLPPLFAFVASLSQIWKSVLLQTELCRKIDRFLVLELVDMIQIPKYLILSICVLLAHLNEGQMGE